MALKRTHLKPRYIFITVPSIDILQQRLEQRLKFNGQGSSLSPISTPNTEKIESSTRKVECIASDITRPTSGLTDDGLHTVYDKKYGDNTIETVHENELSNNNLVKSTSEVDDDIQRWLAKAPGIEAFAKEKYFSFCLFPPYFCSFAYLK